MRFGIVNHEEEVALAREKKADFEELSVGVVRKRPPAATEKEELAVWILESLGIVNGVKPEHPAVTILLELVRRRKAGSGITGSELTALTNIGKTQTYYWLNRMKEAGVVRQGKKKLIEHGAVRVLSGFYLAGPNLSYTIADIKKRAEESFDGMIDVSERLQDVLTAMEVAEEEVSVPEAEEGVGVPEADGSVEVGEPEENLVESVGEERAGADQPDTEKPGTTPQPDSTQPSPQSGNPGLSE